MRITRIFAIAVVFVLFVSETATCQDYSAFKEDYLVSKADTLPYRILLPFDYNPALRYPMLLFLHGSGERGSDNELQLKHGAALFLKDSIRKQFPMIVVFPQCAPNFSWHNATSEMIGDTQHYTYPEALTDNLHQRLLKELVTTLKQRYPLDSKRLYVGGLSMGGIGTFELVRRNPELFAAAFAICGGAHPNLASQVKPTAWRLYHGEADLVVTPNGSIDIYHALRRLQGDASLHLYPGIGHDSWTKAFADPGLLPWLFSKQRLSEDKKKTNTNH